MADSGVITYRKGSFRENTARTGNHITSGKNIKISHPIRRKTAETDDRGRLYLDHALRERYGERFHVVEYRDRIELIPVDEAPLDGLREAVGDALGDRSIEELREIASEEGRRQAADHVR